MIADSVGSETRYEIRDNEIVHLTVNNFLEPKWYLHVIHQMLNYEP
jgi:hypothetical protein